MRFLKWFKNHPTLLQKIRNPDSSDQFFRLRLVAYLEEEFWDETKEFFRDRGTLYYSDEELQGFGDDLPCYQWPLEAPEQPVPLGTVCMDFTCKSKGGEFSFNGFWQVRKTITLMETRQTLLKELPDFDGYSLSSKEQRTIARKIRAFVAQRKHQEDEFGYYVDMNFLEFRDANHL